jgi:hypothetical protein
VAGTSPKVRKDVPLRLLPLQLDMVYHLWVVAANTCGWLESGRSKACPRILYRVRRSKPVNDAVFHRTLRASESIELDHYHWAARAAVDSLTGLTDSIPAPKDFGCADHHKVPRTWTIIGKDTPCYLSLMFCLWLHLQSALLPLGVDQQAIYCLCIRMRPLVYTGPSRMSLVRTRINSTLLSMDSRQLIESDHW